MIYNKLLELMDDQMYNKHSLAGRLLIILSIVFIFIPGPLISFGVIDLRIFDGLISLLLMVLLLHILKYPKVPLPKEIPLLLVLGIFSAMAVGFPISGLIIYKYPIAYIIGDFRWMQFFFLATAIVTIYFRQPNQRLYNDFKLTMEITLVLHGIFYIFQMLVYTNLYDMTGLLDLWYHNQNPYGEVGFKGARFAGAEDNPAALGVTTSIAFLLFAFSCLDDINKKRAFYFALSVILLFASGSRTSLITVAGISVLLVFSLYLKSPSQYINIKNTLFFSGSLLMVSFITFYFNLGEIRSSDRYGEIFGLITGEIDFAEAGGSRVGGWHTVLKVVDSEFTIGTLANPSYVLDPTIDSYYVLAYTQGGLVFLLSYLAILTISFLLSLRFVIKGRPLGILSAGLVLIAIIQSLTQNFITGLIGKSILVLAITFLMLLMIETNSELGTT